MTTSLEVYLLGFFVLMAILALWIAAVHSSRSRRWQERDDAAEQHIKHLETNYNMMANKAIRLENALTDRDTQLQKSKQANDDLEFDHEVYKKTAAEEYDQLTQDRDEWKQRAQTMTELRDDEIASKRAVEENFIEFKKRGAKKYELTAEVVDLTKDDTGTTGGENKRKASGHRLDLLFVGPNGNYHRVGVRSLAPSTKNKAELTKIADEINTSINILVNDKA